jgi:hypothetical protein
MANFPSKPLLGLLLIFVNIHSVYGQHTLNRKDSLIRIIQRSHGDTVKINALVQLGHLIKDARSGVRSSADSAMALGDQALELSRTLRNSIKVGDSYDLLSRVFQAKGDHENAKEFEKKAISAYLTANNFNGAGNAYRQLAGYFSYQDY